MHHAGRIARESGCPSMGASPKSRGASHRSRLARLLGNLAAPQGGYQVVPVTGALRDGSPEQTFLAASALRCKPVWAPSALNVCPTAPRSKPSGTKP